MLYKIPSLWILSLEFFVKGADPMADVVFNTNLTLEIRHLKCKDFSMKINIMER